MGIIAFIISTAFLVFSIVISIKKKNKIVSPNVIFLSLWTFILFLSNLNLYNIIKPSDKAYLLITIMIVFFEIGYNIIFWSRFQIKTTEKKVALRKKIFWIFSVVSLILNVIDIMIVIQQYKKGIPMWQIRNWSLAPYGSSNPILDRQSFVEIVLRNIILTPFDAIIVPIAAYKFFTESDKKEKYSYSILAIVCLILGSVSSGGGRLGFITFVGYYFLAFFLSKKNNKLDGSKIKKYKRYIIILGVLGILAVSFYTIIRAGASNILKQIYTYFALPTTLLSIWLPIIEKTELTYGFTTLFGIHSYIFRFLEKMGLKVLIPNIYYISFDNILNAEKFMNAGCGVANAFVTPVYYFMLDGGIPAVIIFSLIFGIIVSAISKKLNKMETINLRNFVIYCLIMYGIIISFMRIQTAIPAYIISFIYCYIFIGSVKDDNA